MKVIDNFINRYPLSKTLRFSLIPIGKTEENFNDRLLLEEDKQRAEDYEKVKKYIDRYHKVFIESVLADFYLEDISSYALLYYKNDKSEKDLKEMEKIEGNMRKSISKAFKGNKIYKDIFSKDMIESILPDFLTDEEEKSSVRKFQKFSTYFVGFNSNRENIYADDIQQSIAYRCINDNLPKFLDNIKSFKKIITSLGDKEILSIGENIELPHNVSIFDAFEYDYFNFALSQAGIDLYNELLGGYSKQDGTKIQGINEKVNLYNQQVAKNDKTKRLPLLKPLYKQILSEHESVSFIPEKFKSDNETIAAVKGFYETIAIECINEINKVFSEFKSYDMNGIYISSGVSVTDISNSVFGKWNAVIDSWNEEYEKVKPLKKGKNPETYYEEERKVYNKIKSFSISELQRLGDKNKTDECIGNIAGFIENGVKEKIELVKKAYFEAKNLLNSNYEEEYDKKLCANETAIGILKTLLDSIKDLERFIKPLRGTGKEENKDEYFYGSFINIYDNLSLIDAIYDKVRNYATQKPYSKDKIKLNFQNPQLLGGWDRNKERDYRTVLLTKNNKYYLAVMDKADSSVFVAPPESNGSDSYKKVEYKLLPGPNKMLPKVFFANSNIEFYSPSDEILRIRKEESFKKGTNFNKKDCDKFIDFFKKSIEKHPEWSNFGFEFSPTENYKDISEFYNEVKKQGYSIKYVNVPDSYIDELVENGKIYLFQIYNKDFSEGKTKSGTDNLHTLYFKMLFDERNLKDIVYQLNGGAEIFYRQASIKDKEKIIHPANQPIENKNSNNKKKTSIFTYDMIKDKRFTKRQFSLHVPITLNFKADGQTFLNNDVRQAVKDAKENYVIGIDRGERNLLYYCVINSKGEIVEQRSLNKMEGYNCYVDYQELLDKREKERDKARKNWGTVENIKDLKEGYLSQVIHEICNLVIKYDAIIAMEDLNFGFKKGRFKVEKQVYQKFENMLITKLNYLVDKNTDPCENGGLLKAYQLTNKVDGVNRGKQNGIIFYVPAYLTSKIDPTTGFVDLLKLKYTSVVDSVKFTESLDDIRYNPESDMFEFDLDYSKYPRCSSIYKKKWTLHSNGKRIRTYINPNKNNQWDNEEIKITDEFKSLFEKFEIDYTRNIKVSIINNDKKEFHKQFIKLMALVMQMRNSETGNVDKDYLISPVKNSTGEFYDSNNYTEDSPLPCNADANGAYNIARKALWAVDVIKETEDDKLRDVKLSISNADWFEYTQK